MAVFRDIGETINGTSEIFTEDSPSFVGWTNLLQSHERLVVESDFLLWDCLCRQSRGKNEDA